MVYKFTVNIFCGAVGPPLSEHFFDGNCATSITRSVQITGFFLHPRQVVAYTVVMCVVLESLCVICDLI